MKILPTLGFLLIAVVFAPLAAAQTTGVDTGGGQQVPPEVLYPEQYGNGNAQPQQPQAQWASRWGAVAFDRASGAEGHITDQIGKSQAEDAAMNSCAAHGGKQCEILLSYANECGAVAQEQGGGIIAGAYATDSRKAESNAVNKCGQSTCQVVYSACSLPARIQ